MRRIDDQAELGRIIRDRVGFLGNDSEKGGRRWHDLTRLQPGCKTKGMRVSPPSTYKKYFAATREEIPELDDYCRWCWS